MASGHDPLADPQRLRLLADTGLLDAPQDEQLRQLNVLAQQLLGVPVSIVSLVDADRQVHAAQRGLFDDETNHSELPIANSFCANVVITDRPLVVDDARTEPLVADNPSITEYGVIAYAGYPIRLDEGKIVGVFCAIDHQPRSWTQDELQIIADLTHVATAVLQQRQASDSADEAAEPTPAQP